jgi:hypothetical protein
MNGPCRPECIICHRDNEGGGGTADRAFVKKLIEHGFDPWSKPLNFEEALKRAEDAGQGDTDGDGVSDREALLLGIDPNNGASMCSGVQYGCARVAPAPSGLSAHAVGIAALVLLGLARVAAQRRCISTP